MRDVLAFIVELLARCLSGKAQERLAHLACRLLPDLPKLSGHWTLTFHDPSPKGRPVLLTVYASLHQYGRRIEGTGHIADFPEDSFRFSGTLRRNVFYGTFARDDAHVLAGTGSFVLKVAPDSRRLMGWCMWYDGLLDRVWASRYVWRRKSGRN